MDYIQTLTESEMIKTCQRISFFAIWMFVIIWIQLLRMRYTKINVFDKIISTIIIFLNHVVFFGLSGFLLPLLILILTDNVEVAGYVGISLIFICQVTLLTYDAGGLGYSYFDSKINSVLLVTLNDSILLNN